MDNEESKPQRAEPKSIVAKAVDWISRNPLFTLILLVIAVVADVASIVGALCGIFPWWTAPKPDLSYCVYPIRIPIVQTTNTSDVSVSYKGQPVSGNVTAAEIAIWNAGRQPIHSNDIERPLILTVANNVPLFETGLSQVSRDVTECSLVNHGAIDIMSGKHLGPSSVELKFRILEHNDGVRLRVVYAGAVDAPITLKGVIEGQHSMHEVKAMDSGRASLLDAIFALVIAGLCWFAALMMMVGAHKSLQSDDARKHPYRTKAIALCVIICSAVVIISAAAFVLTTMVKATSLPATPFGF
jgi:hypothetical protein